MEPEVTPRWIASDGAPVEFGARCQEHPAYEADYCPICGTARPIGTLSPDA